MTGAAKGHQRLRCANQLRAVHVELSGACHLRDGISLQAQKGFIGGIPVSPTGLAEDSHAFPEKLMRKQILMRNCFAQKFDFATKDLLRYSKIYLKAFGYPAYLSYMQKNRKVEESCRISVMSRKHAKAHDRREGKQLFATGKCHAEGRH